MMRDVCLIAVAISLLTGCKPVQRYDSTFIAMGTRIDLNVMSDSPVRAAAAAGSIERTMLQWSSDWYPWTKQNGELKQLNTALAAGQTMQISTELRDLLQRSKALSIASDGYFDPAVAPMVMAWGFDNSGDNAASTPDAETIAAWSDDHATMQDIDIDVNNVSSKHHNIQLDLGAIAKGYAVDLSMQRLRTLGITAATINIGGQILVMGNADWHSREVLVRDPRSSTSLASVILNNGESISTSGDYERFHIVDGKRTHHLLDPHTGIPVAHTQMVTVIANTATLADAASTAIMAAGPANWQRVAKQIGVSQILRVDSTGEIQTTAAMYARLHWDKSAAKTHPLTQVN